MPIAIRLPGSTRTAVLGLCVAVVVVGCEADRDSAAEGVIAGAGDSPEVQTSDSLRERAPTVPDTVATTTRDTILLEGMPEVIDVQRVESPDDFPLPFVTAVPGDMVVEFQADGVRFEAAFGGVRSPQAFLELRVFHEEGDLEEVREAALEASGGDELEAIDPPRLEWADEEYRRRGNELGFLALSREEDRTFYMNARYPAEFADGMGPRLNLILSRWRWTQDGSSLVGD